MEVSTIFIQLIYSTAPLCIQFVHFLLITVTKDLGGFELPAFPLKLLNSDTQVWYFWHKCYRMWRVYMKNHLTQKRRKMAYCTGACQNFPSVDHMVTWSFLKFKKGHMTYFSAYATTDQGGFFKQTLRV